MTAVVPLGPVRYFYCSTKVFNASSGEGLANPRMPFQNFMEMEFFKSELEDTKNGWRREDIKTQKT